MNDMTHTTGAASGTAGIESDAASATVPEVPVFDRAGLAERLGDDELVDIFVAKFRAAIPAYVDELRSTLETASIDAVAAVAHAVKGLAANIGAEQVHQVAAAMEVAARTGDTGSLTALHSRLLMACEIFARETSP
ncbi:Hpt domain-containing protein [Geobacter sp. SVR]|uniref:Hpt domain-containing protein n=1 Tax=Geobacter sp. SVR TaxID=2495594 RepID=UPI00143EFCF8|nr:Hpt domain-containing protein [Geobacter sp. SVR]BCS52703.1 hypothetical protein GSVR_10110 [Geobacter sp. SVR]GCF86801.1 hypothetical protein GSbR_34010 [Geobacter sp. SVR]